MTRAFLRTVMPFSLAGVAILAIALMTSHNWAEDTSDDLDGDEVADDMVADPQPPGASPGEITIHSGVDGAEIARISGIQDYDEFGRAVAAIGDVNGDGFNDVLVGAPSKDAGEAYIFYGPPVRNGSGTFNANEADIVLTSPYDDDYAFGEAVARLYDFDEDGLPDVRVRASIDLASGETNSRTFFFSGLTGQLIGIVFGELSDWMWDNLLGDLNNDGVVDAADIALLQSRLSLDGELTAFDGDLNGDGVIDQLDVNLLNALFGVSLLTSIFDQTSSCQFVLESGDCTHYYICGPGNVPVWWATFCRTSAASGAPLPFDRSSASGGEDEGEGGGGGSMMLMGGCPPAQCMGDIVTSATFQPPHDGFIDAADLAYLLGEWGNNPGSLADFVSSATFQPPPDGKVDAADLAVLLGAWGECDFDGDGIPNWWEEEYGYPFDPCIVNEDGDLDSDGLSDDDEFAQGTNPIDADSDGDGVSDGAEIISGANPNNPNDNGIGPNSDNLMYVMLRFGDQSCHFSELWWMKFNGSTYFFPDALLDGCDEPQGAEGALRRSMVVPTSRAERHGSHSH